MRLFIFCFSQNCMKRKLFTNHFHLIKMSWSFTFFYLNQLLHCCHASPRLLMSLTSSTLFFSTWNAGVIHWPHEHFLPEKITSPSFVWHFGQLNFISLSISFMFSQIGCSMKIDVQSLPECTNFEKRTCRHFLHLYLLYGLFWVTGALIYAYILLCCLGTFIVLLID